MAERFRKPLAVIVGDKAEKLNAVISNNISVWDFQPPCSAASRHLLENQDGVKVYGESFDPNPSLAQLEERIANKEDFDVMMITSHTFDPKNKVSDFEDTIAEYSKYLLVVVLNFHKEYAEEMRRRVYDASDGEVDQSMFYLVNPGNWISELDDATKDFIKKSKDNEYRKETADYLLYGERLRNGSADEDEYNEDLEYQYATTERGSGTVVAVTSSKGGVGKSTTAISLATYLAHFSAQGARIGQLEEPYRVIIVDMDILDGQIGFFTGNHNQSSNVLGLHRENINDANLKKNIIHDDGLGVDLLLASKNPLNAKDIEASFYEKLINELSKRYDFVILDTSVDHTGDALSTACYPLSDFIVLVTEPLRPSMHSVSRWIKHVTGDKELGHLGISPYKIMIGITKYMKDNGDHSNMSQEELFKAARGVDIVAVFPNLMSFLANATNDTSMERVLENKGFRENIGHIAQRVANNSLPSDEEYVRAISGASS